MAIRGRIDRPLPRSILARFETFRWSIQSCEGKVHFPSDGCAEAEVPHYEVSISEVQASVKIWHQSMAPLDEFGAYRDVLRAHLDAVLEPGIEVDIHGLSSGAYAG